MAGTATPLRTVIVGNGGHARVIHSILRLDAGISVVGLVGPVSGGTFAGLPLLGGDDALPAIWRSRAEAAFVAVGDNGRRHALFTAAQQLGFTMVNAIHPKAVVDGGARLGTGIAAMAGAVVNTDALLEDAVIINTGSSVDHDCRVRQAAHVAPGAHLSGYVEIGPRTLVGVGASIGRGRPLRIGADVVVGTGAVVVHDVPDGQVVVGVPARPLPRLP